MDAKTTPQGVTIARDFTIRARPIRSELKWPQRQSVLIWKPKDGYVCVLRGLVSNDPVAARITRNFALIVG